MTLQEFLKDDIFQLPIVQSDRNKDFVGFLQSGYRKFINKLKTIEHFEDSEFSKDLIIQRQEHLTKNLLNAVIQYFDGKPAIAYDYIEKALESDIKQFAEVLYLKRHLPGTNFYRLREHEENYPLSKEQMFHVPFELRGKVTTQRFSIPGFPSLYISDSVYTCWEELNRPNINDFSVVRLNSTESIRVLNLAPPKDATPQRYYHYLMTWPITFGCSIRVKNKGDSFKPEYIIPQLLLQWIRKKDEIDGIEYQTTHIDFSKSQSTGDFLNIVLPVKEKNTQGHCAHLKSMFEMTESISYQMKQFASDNAFTFDGGPIENARVDKIELINGSPLDYDISAFGGLESVLNGMDTSEID